MMHVEEFGWLPIRHDYAGATFRVETADDFERSIKEVVSSGQTDDDWYWPPLEPHGPPRPVQVYALPTTHLVHAEGGPSEAQRLIEFLVTVLGFLYGMLLTPGGWVNFYRVCIKPSRWHDFYIQTAACARILGVAEKLWLTSSGEAREAVFGALRWHTFALSYDHPFERFLAQYMVLDAVWRAHSVLKASKSKITAHSARIGALCKYYNVVLPPSWSSSKPADLVVKARNQLVHEARWGGEPLGFGHPDEPLDVIHLDLAYVNARLILALLGEDHPYIHSPLSGGAGRQLIR
jgi:hypothetical protein